MELVKLLITGVSIKMKDVLSNKDVLRHFQ